MFHILFVIVWTITLDLGIRVINEFKGLGGVINSYGVLSYESTNTIVKIDILMLMTLYSLTTFIKLAEFLGIL